MSKQISNESTTAWQNDAIRAITHVITLFVATVPISGAVFRQRKYT